MTIPSNLFGIFYLVFLVLPGVVWIGVRSRLRGYLAKDNEVASRILQALGVSAVLDGLYLIAFGPWLIELAMQSFNGSQLTTLNLRWTATLALLLFVAVPAALSYLVYAEWRKPNVGPQIWLPFPGPYRSTPTAWDRVMTSKVDQYVRIRIESGRWVGGWYNGDAYFSTYPEPRDLFIARQYEVDAEGKFVKPVEDSAGFWIRIQDHYVVEWLSVTDDPPSAQS